MLVPAALAWSCVGLMSLTTSSSAVRPGGTLTVFGKEFAQGVPIEIHLDSATGPVLARVPAPTDTMTSQFSVMVTIPAATQDGEHVLVATQASHYMNAGAPARSVIHVGTAAPAPTPPAVRPAKVVVDAGPSAISLLLIGLAVAAVGLLVAALWSMLAARRHDQPGPVGAA
jgi:alpha-L-fucosidase